MLHSPLPTGVELDDRALLAKANVNPANGLTLTLGSMRLLSADLFAQTDGHAQLVQEREWLLTPSERLVSLRGIAFAIENGLSGEGTALLKLAPLPDERPEPVEWDVRIESGTRLEWNQSDGYNWERIPYANGKWGRIAALQAWSRTLRPLQPGRDGLLLTNTWGDRGRDAHLSEAFMLREVEAAARLGADIVQIDDGWQNGVTQNSHQSNGDGAWSGFWASNPGFWNINRTRFPSGLKPLTERARALNMKFGLWFAPDSSNQGELWERDADALLRLHREESIDFFKIDALKIGSKTAENNLRQLFAKVARESKGAVTFDLDITAENRFGYFGLIEPGPLFLQNRYTDWTNYWPHATLRALWGLTHWLDPVRLRLEWLNNTRNAQNYNGHPLAPSNWAPETLFAISMLASPLGWFEVQHLPDSYFERVAPLVRTWKTHRSALHGNTTFPVGSAPDGASWTGFVSLNQARNAGYALVLRELHPSGAWQIEVPLWRGRDGEAEVLGGTGRARVENGVLHVEDVEELGFVWARLSA